METAGTNSIVCCCVNGTNACLERHPHTGHKYLLFWTHEILSDGWRFSLSPAHLQDAGLGSEQGKGEGHSGCYDNFMMVFGK